MADTMTSQNIDLSSWGTRYILSCVIYIMILINKCDTVTGQDP
jgi:hypothetical protein